MLSVDTDPRDSVEANQIYQPWWKVTRGVSFEDPATCIEFLEHVVSPGEHIAHKFQPWNSLSSDAVFHHVQSLSSLVWLSWCAKIALFMKRRLR